MSDGEWGRDVRLVHRGINAAIVVASTFLFAGLIVFHRAAPIFFLLAGLLLIGGGLALALDVRGVVGYSIYRSAIAGQRHPFWYGRRRHGGKGAVRTNALSQIVFGLLIGFWGLSGAIAALADHVH